MYPWGYICLHRYYVETQQERVREKQRVAARWSITNKQRGQQDGRRVKDIGSRRRNGTQKDEGKRRKCEEIKNDLQILAGCYGHLGWEDETEDRSEMIKVLCWPCEDRQPFFLPSYFSSPRKRRPTLPLVLIT